ncbi:MAG: hypothetical protein WCF22_00755 [Candidatus Sulfotelmatobacter sp.]
MPDVVVVPVYVEVPSGWERAVGALESHLRRAGYLFQTGEPIAETLETTKLRLGANCHGGLGTGTTSGAVEKEHLPELRAANSGG